MTLLHMNALSQTESPIFMPLVYSQLPEDLHSEHYCFITYEQDYKGMIEMYELILEFELSIEPAL